MALLDVMPERAATVHYYNKMAACMCWYQIGWFRSPSCVQGNGFGCRNILPYHTSLKNLLKLVSIFVFQAICTESDVLWMKADKIMANNYTHDVMAPREKISETTTEERWFYSAHSCAGGEGSLPGNRYFSRQLLHGKTIEKMATSELY